MKTLSTLLLLVTALAAIAADPPAKPPAQTGHPSAVGAEVRLTGIVCFGGKKRVLCEVSLPGRAYRIRAILQSGERVKNVECVAIDEKMGAVTFKLDNKEPLVLSVAETAAADGVTGRTFNLKSADSVQLLEIYQEITGRTVLPSPSLPRALIDLQSPGALSSEAAATGLAQSFAGKSIALVPHGAKFAFAIPVSQEERLRDIKPLDESNENSLEERLPAGLIKFSEADLAQVLEIYQELTGRTVISSANRPRLKITMRNQTPWTRRESFWAVEAAIRLGGVAVSPHQEKFVVVQSSLSAEPPEEFVSNQKVVATTGTQSVPAGGIKFYEARPEEFLRLYASLLAREALPLEPSLPGPRVSLRNQTPFTTGEAVYALDALAAVNGLQLVLVGDKQVKLVPARLARPSSASNLN